MSGMLIAVVLLVLAIIIGGVTSFMAVAVASIGFVIAFALFVLALLIGIVSAVTEQP